VANEASSIYFVTLVIMSVLLSYKTLSASNP
jgi:hypothetical protein